MFLCLVWLNETGFAVTNQYVANENHQIWPNSQTC